jgi:hypothetical protein
MACPDLRTIVSANAGAKKYKLAINTKKVFQRFKAIYTYSYFFIG